MVPRIGRQHRGRHFERAPSGRIAAVFEPLPESGRHELGQKLSEVIEGEVRFDVGSRALYATDASNYRQVPLGVVIPRTLDDILMTVAVCRKHKAAILLRGGGTSLAGQGCNVAVLLDCSKYLNHILRIDPDRRLAKVEPGCVLDDLRKAAETHHLTFGPDPSTHDHCTLGGMIGNNACGVHSVMAGRTSDNVEELDIVTYDGLRMSVGRTSENEMRAILAEGGRRAEIYRSLDSFRQKYAQLIRARYPKIPRRVSGYENLDELLPENGFNVARALVGTEGTCVTVLAATLNLVPSPQKRILAVVAFPDIFTAADAVPEMLSYGPIGLEAIDDLFVKFLRRKHFHTEYIKKLPEGGGWLLAEFGGDTEQGADAAERLVRDVKAKGHAAELLRDASEQQKLWRVRRDGLPATAKLPRWPETYEGWEDSAVPREKLGDYLREFKALLHSHGYESAVYGHFGDGLVHCRIDFDLRTEEGVQNWQSFLEKAADLVVRYGGSLSGEHGDGQSKAALLEKLYGPELIQAFREFKTIWDPDSKMNPGKVVDPFPITSNLRIGPLYKPKEITGYFAYPEDGGSFTRATRRCVGVGTCRRRDSDNGVMCPSYMATGEEMHSTRGRARLLFEMLHGGAITSGWRSREVEEALNLCLACKACKRDCPVQVDMATYKAEFRSHYYARHLRPRAAYSMGLIHRWSRIAGEVPWLANFVFQTTGLAAASKWIGGIAQQRSMPRYARETFVRWFRKRRERPANGRRVLLWPDTFNNYFRVPTAIAATTVLENLGYQVVIPAPPLCCGRPLYDWGWLDAAKALWRRTFDVLRPEIEAGTPIVGIEPACVSAFRDELPGLFPGDDLARRLAASASFLSEFLDREGADLAHLRTGARALVQFHCHHHAILDTSAERHVLDRLGLDYEVMASGCCGMAGAFGFEAEKYAVSMAAAQRVLLPKVRAASPDVLILANGFSCREQIEQGTGRAAIHIADLMASQLVSRP